MLRRLHSNQPALLCQGPGAQTKVWSGQLCSLGAQSSRIFVRELEWHVRVHGQGGRTRWLQSHRDPPCPVLWESQSPFVEGQVVGGLPISMIYCSV